MDKIFLSEGNDTGSIPALDTILIENSNYSSKYKKLISKKKLIYFYILI